MKATILAVQIFPLILTAVLLYFLPSFSRRGTYFGATVEEQFPPSPEGIAIRRSYRIEILAWAFLCLIAAAFAAIYAPALVPTPLFLLVLLASISYYRRFQGIHRRHGTTPRDVREAFLAIADEGSGINFWIALFPFVILASASIYLVTHWSQIPPTFPVHYGADGLPNRWVERSVASVFQPVLFGFYLDLFLLGLAWLSAHWARRSSMQRLTVRCLQWLTWSLSVMFGLVALMPIIAFPVWVVLVVSLGGVLAVVAWMIRAYASLPDIDDPPPQPDSYWKAGIFYYAPDDPALFVEKRTGLGMTMNFGNRWSWIVLIAVLGSAVLPVVVAICFRQKG